MKKMMVYLLAASMIFVLCACGPAEPAAEDVSDPLEVAGEAAQGTGEFVPAEGLQGAVSEAQPGDTAEDAEEQEEEEPGLPGSVGMAESYWYESDSGSSEYTDLNGNEMAYSYSVPAFNLDSADASDMNEEIEAICAPIIAEMQEAEETGFSLMYNSVSYEAYQNGDIVSLLLIMNTDIEVVEYHVFNLNVVTGERASGAEMVNVSGLTEDAFVEAAMAATEAKFMELYDGMQEDVDNFDEQLAKTMSADVFSLSAPMYLNGEGKLCIIARIYALAGASYYDHILELG